MVFTVNSETIENEHVQITENPDGDLEIADKTSGKSVTIDETGVSIQSLNVTNLRNVQYISPTDDLQTRLDEFGETPVTFVIPSGTFTAPEYGFRVDDNTTIIGDRHKTTIEAAAPGGEGADSAKYAFLNWNHHQGTGEGNGNIHIEGVTVRGQIRLTADSSQYEVESVTLRDLTCIDNDGWQIYVQGWNGVYVDNIRCRNYDAGVDPGGNDGVHTVDCRNVSISGVWGHTGDDLVSIEARNRASHGISVSDIHGKSEIACIVKVHTHSTSTAGNDLYGVTIQGISSDGGSRLVKTNGEGGGTFRDITITDGYADFPTDIPVHISAGADFTIENITLRDVPMRAVYVRADDVHIADIRAISAPDNSAGGIDFGSENGRVRDCHVSGFGEHCMSVHRPSAQIRGCHLDASSGNQAINIQAADVTVERNKMSNGGVINPNDSPRLLVNGWGTNTGDPSAEGEWNTFGKEGVIVRDTAGNQNFVFINGSWEQL